MKGCSHGDCLVGVDAFVRRFTGFLLNGFLDGGHASGTTNKNHFVYVAFLESSIFHRLPSGNHCLLDQFGDEVLEFSPRKREVHVDRLTVSHGDEREVDLRLLGPRQFNLGFLSSFFES